MKDWPLRWKVALYSAVLAIAATLGGATTTWFFLRHREIAAFDRRLTTDAQEFFRDVEYFEGPRKQPRPFQRNFVPLALRDRLLQVSDASGKVLYLSPELRQPFPKDGIKVFHNQKLDGHTVRFAEFSEKGLTLRLGDDLADINQVGRDILYGMLAAIPIVSLITLVGASWVAGKAIAPIREIGQAATRITAPRLDQRLPVPPTRDEIADLIVVLNGTFERLQRSFEQSARFSADASHHLKTPIAVLRAGVEEILADGQCSDRVQALADDLLDRIRQLTSVVDNLLLLARADAGRLQPATEQVDLKEILEGALEDACALAGSQNLTIESDIPERLEISADSTFLRIIIQNLVENAVKYNRLGGRIRVETHVANGELEVTIANTGATIPRERSGQLFERFYRVTLDERVKGQGLGLSIARELARAQGGDVQLVLSENDWTEMRLRLPSAVKQESPG